MREKIYLDSTIPSYYFDQRESLRTFYEITRKWWIEMSHTYEVFISDAVLQELNVGDYPRKKEIMEFTTRIPLLTKAQDLAKISEFYVENYVMPGSLGHLEK